MSHVCVSKKIENRNRKCAAPQNASWRITASHDAELPSTPSSFAGTTLLSSNYKTYSAWVLPVRASLNTLLCGSPLHLRPKSQHVSLCEAISSFFLQSFQHSLLTSEYEAWRRWRVLVTMRPWDGSRSIRSISIISQSGTRIQSASRTNSQLQDVLRVLQTYSIWNHHLCTQISARRWRDLEDFMGCWWLFHLFQTWTSDN